MLIQLERPSEGYSEAEMERFANAIARYIEARSMSDFINNIDRLMEKANETRKAIHVMGNNL